MNKVSPKVLMTKKKGGDHLIGLSFGDIFVSFHTEENCIGLYIKKTDLNKSILESQFSKVLQEISLPDLIKAEAKLIGAASSIKVVEEFLLEKKVQHLKKVAKEGSIEVMFLPALCKVRVSKEVLQESVKDNKTSTKFKVLIVDDSKTIRNILSRIISTDKDFEVCAMAEKPSEVEALILKHKPDVITLDIHMPEMDGVTLLKQIAPKFNIPTVMISSISMAEGPLVLEALENGAIDYIQKPELSEIERVTPLILEKVRTAAKANLSKPLRKRNVKAVQVTTECDLNSFIVLGSSTGGTEAIKEILTALPNQIPPMLIVQHIPAVFSAAFAKRMNDLCPFEVKEAENGDEVKSNRVLIAPGGKQMKFLHKNGKSSVEITDDEPVNRFKPSVDYMFLSVAKNVFTHSVAVILTGMGKDGAKGMLELRKLGFRTIAQDESTSVVFGMPKEAIAIGGAEFVEPLPDIAERITALTHKDRSREKRIS